MNVLFKAYVTFASKPDAQLWRRVAKKARKTKAAFTGMGSQYRGFFYGTIPVAVNLSSDREVMEGVAEALVKFLEDITPVRIQDIDFEELQYEALPKSVDANVAQDAVPVRPPRRNRSILPS
jgi:hypothetical protein